MAPLKIRLTCEHLNVENPVPTILRMTDTPESALIVQEHVPHEHIHAYIDCNRTIKTVRKNLDKILTCTGNEAKALGENHTDWKGYLGYCLKGVPDNCSILHYGKSLLPVEELQNYHKKLAQKSPVKQIDNKCNDVLQWIEKNNLPYETYKDIVCLVLKFYVKRKMPINEKYVGQIAKTLYLEKKPEHIHLVADRILSEHAPELVNANCIEEESIMKKQYDNNLKMRAYQKIRIAESQYREGCADYLQQNLGRETDHTGTAWAFKQSDTAVGPLLCEQSELA